MVDGRDGGEMTSRQAGDGQEVKERHNGFVEGVGVCLRGEVGEKSFGS